MQSIIMHMDEKMIADPARKRNFDASGLSPRTEQTPAVVVGGEKTPGGGTDHDLLTNVHKNAERVIPTCQECVNDCRCSSRTKG